MGIVEAKVLIVGSIAFDIIFSISHDFRNSIPVEKGEIRNFNASFVADEKKEFPGGTAGNISYWLGKENIPSVVFSAFGKDFWEKGYEKKLKDLNVTIRGNTGRSTAHAYLISDPLHQQLIIWQPNAYEVNERQSLLDFFTNSELAQFEYAIFAAGTPKSILRHIFEFRENNTSAMVIFDPGQITPLFEENDFHACCSKSNILIGNNIEFHHYQKWGIPENLIAIETRGESGVCVKQQNTEKIFPVQKVTKVVETTGAGDAFRAGFIAGLVNGTSFDAAVENGIKRGAECVQMPSGQGEI